MFGDILIYKKGNNKYNFVEHKKFMKNTDDFVQRGFFPVAMSTSGDNQTLICFGNIKCADSCGLASLYDLRKCLSIANCDELFIPSVENLRYFLQHNGINLYNEVVVKIIGYHNYLTFAFYNTDLKKECVIWTDTKPLASQLLRPYDIDDVGTYLIANTFSTGITGIFLKCYVKVFMHLKRTDCPSETLLFLLNLHRCL